MSLSDVFKYTQALGQKGHQIGRKVGDAIELLTLGMINLDENLSRFLIIEDGVEGATTARHTVEFSFYNLENLLPSKQSKDLFGLIECKKVGVEQTIKQNFKNWLKQPLNRQDFYLTNGYSLTISPSDTDFKWIITVSSSNTDGNNLSINVTRKEDDIEDEIESHLFTCASHSQLLIALDNDNDLHILGVDEILSSIPKSLNRCIIIQIEAVSHGNVTKINVNESLPGPQTPEKAKQASFVSLDVRKKVLGQFDISENKSFISILVIGEASHWEVKSRAIIRLCNDYNLIVPDEILVYLFEQFEARFNGNSQEQITKTIFKNSHAVRDLVMEIIEHFERRILYDMETGKFVQFRHALVGDSNRLTVEEME